MKEFASLAKSQGARVSSTNVTVGFLSTRVASHASAVIAGFRRGMQEATGKRFRGGNAASSGLLGALLLLLLGCPQVSAFGFSVDECRKQGCLAPYHYFFRKAGFLDSDWLRAHASHSCELLPLPS